MDLSFQVHKCYLEHYKGNVYCNLIDLREFELTTPDATRRAKDMNQIKPENLNLDLVCVVTQSPLVRRLLEEIDAPIENECFCHSMEEALE